MKKTSVNQTEQILRGKNLWKNMILLSLPLFLNNLIRSFQGIIDTFFVARIFENPEQTQSALAAVNLHDNVYNVFLAFGTGLAVATVAVIAQYLGANRKDKANQYASLFVTLAIIIGIIITLTVSLSAPFLVDALGATGDTAVFAREYFVIRSLEYSMVLFFMVYQAIRQAGGNTLKPTILNICGIITNSLLIMLFVQILGWGMTGLAFSTVIGNSIFIPLMVIDLVKSKKEVTISIKGLIPDQQRIKEILPFALPAAAGQAFSSAGFVVINAFILFNFDDVVASSFAVGNRLSNLLMTPVVALSSVAAIYIGTNIGNKQPERALASYKTSRNLAFGFSLIAITIAIPLRRFFINGLVGSGNYELTSIAMSFTFWLLLTQPFMALFQNYTAIFNGSGKSKNTLKIALARLWIFRIPTLLLLHFVFNLEYSSVWFAMLASNVLVLFVAEFLKRRTSLDVMVNINEEEVLA